MEWVVAFTHALGLDRPLIMGVSVSGQLAADILAHHGDVFGGGIAMNGTYHDDSMGDVDNSPFNDPRIPREYFASARYEVTSPLAPESLRQENSWPTPPTAQASTRATTCTTARSTTCASTGASSTPARRRSTPSSASSTR
jgi:pimeloyl-ACP methyl ester carboxylesterase